MANPAYTSPINLTPGARLGAYEIVSALGAGGMGEVYRARDTKLNRDVAIKVLLPAVANDPDRLARFGREAQVLASLNHPNIAHIHGLEESDGVTALVLELVEGEDLSRRIARGPIPLDEALPIARQIAEALEAAHDQGIIHRDLKPANIKVRPDGTVKVLDFGLAKAIEPGSADTMNSPTMSLHATRAGVILGTAAYMSPEQARGRPVDRRADIWAFGVVLFEMLTATRAFPGGDVTDTIVSVVSKEPDWHALPPTVPTDVRRLLTRCLHKDPKARMRDIGEARLAIDDGPSAAAMPDASTTTAASGAIPAARVRRANLATVAVSAVVGAGLAGAVTWMMMQPAPTRLQPVRFSVTPPAGLVLATVSPDRDLAISPAGTHLVYQTGIGASTSELHVRAIDQLESVQLRGITGARAPFISPDGLWIGFWGQATTDAGALELKKVAMTGGPSITLCRMTGELQGASWGADGAIVFATADRPTGLMQVPAGGGEPAVLTRPDPEHGERDHVLPFLLPGDGTVLFTIVPTDNIPGNFQIAALDLKTGQRKTLIRGGSHAAYVDPSPGSGQAGYLVYAAAGTLRAVRFDPVRLEVQSDPVPVVEQVATKTNGTADFSVSRTGTLVYVAGVGEQVARRMLVWVDRKGHEEPIKSPPRAYVVARLSPDGTRLALDIRDQESDIWTWDFARQMLTRLTFDPAVDVQPVWTPDSRRIIFASQRDGLANLFWRAADGTGADERLTTNARGQYPNSVTPDGTYVLGHEVSAKTSNDVVQIALDGASSQRPSEPLVQTAFTELDAQISPDGRYLAYQSNESGRPEIYVRPYPKVSDGRWQVSPAGGTRPAWARNGRELFYVDAAALLTSVPVHMAGPTFSAGNPSQLFGTKYSTPVNVRNYDVSADGQRFVMIKEVPGDDKAPPARIVVVENWFEELRARVPQK